MVELMDFVHSKVKSAAEKKDKRGVRLIGDIGEGKESSSVRKMSVLPVTLQPLSTKQRDCNGLERQSGSLSGQKTSGVTVMATIRSSFW
jgi:hypothetical protein